MTSPVEMVPTLSPNIVINRYFWKRAVLIRKKPCNLAAFFWSRKNRQVYNLSGNPARPGAPLWLKNKGGFSTGKKATGFFK